MDSLSALDPLSWDPEFLKDHPAYAAGNALGWLYRGNKQASTNQPLSGRLYLSKSGWLLLAVPNALVRGVFDALTAPGAELPTAGAMNLEDSKADLLNAHISVMTADEVASIGADKINERGHMFGYALGSLKELSPGSDSLSKVWVLQVSAPSLAALRKSYGLSPMLKGDEPFHITVAVRRKNVLRNNSVSKGNAGEDDMPVQTSSRGELKAASESKQELPWRDRVEIFAKHPRTGKIYGGIFDNDNSFAAPGGGIDPGETPEQAAVRELAEETGIHAINPILLPIAPVTNPWSDEYRARTGRNFAGSRTQFVAADFAKKLRNKNLDVWNANNRKFYSPAQALELMQNKTLPSVGEARRLAIQHIMNSAQKAAAAEPAASPWATFVIAPHEKGYAATTRPTGDGKFGLPGGKLDPGEDPLAAVQREAGEEGWDVSNVHPEPLHKADIDGKPVWWYRAESAAPRKEFKEQGRVIPTTAQQDQLTEFGNDAALKIYLAALAQQKTAAADPATTILVSGHSGAGKSTLSKALAEQLKLPLYQVDHHPAQKAFFDNNKDGQETVVGSPEYEEFQKIRRQTAEDTLASVNGPAIVEGAQLAGLSPEQLAAYKNRVYVHTPLQQLLKQRLERQQRRQSAKGREWTPEIAAKKYQIGRAVYDVQNKLMRQYSRLPNTLQYNTTKDQVAAIVAQLQQAQKSAASQSSLPGKNDSVSSQLSRTGTNDLLPGGKADNVPDREFSPKALNEGQEDEREHTDNDQVAKKIAADHLPQDPRDYEENREIAPTARPRIIEELLAAKNHSDNKRYGHKAQILRKLMAQAPQDWVIDDAAPKFQGITHTPTKFRFHTDRTSIPTGVKAAFNVPGMEGSVYGQQLAQSLISRPLQYDYNKPVFQNVQNHLQQVKQRGDFMLQAQQNQQRYRAALDPQYRYQLAMQAFRGNMPGPSWQDQLIEHYGDGALNQISNWAEGMKQ